MECEWSNERRDLHTEGPGDIHQHEQGRVAPPGLQGLEPLEVDPPGFGDAGLGHPGLVA